MSQADVGEQIRDGPVNKVNKVGYFDRPINQ